MISDEELTAELQNERREDGLLNVLYNAAIRFRAFRPEHYQRNHFMDREQLNDMLDFLRRACHEVNDVTNKEEHEVQNLHYTATKSGGCLDIRWQLYPTAAQPQRGKCCLLYLSSLGHKWHAFHAPDVAALSAELRHIEEDCSRWEQELPELRARIRTRQQQLREGRDALLQLCSELQESLGCKAHVIYSKNNYVALVQTQLAEHRFFQFILKAEMGSERLRSMRPGLEAAVTVLRRAAHLNLNIYQRFGRTGTTMSDTSSAPGLGLTPRQHQELLPHILNRSVSEDTLRLRYLRMRFRLHPSQRHGIPCDPLIHTSEQELEDTLTSLRDAGFNFEETEHRRYGNRHHSHGTRSSLTAEHEGFTLHFHAYRNMLTPTKRQFGYRFTLTTPAGDHWEYRKSNGRSPLSFVKSCLRNWQSWEEAWLRCLSEVRKLRKRDEVGSASLQLILNKAAAGIGWSSHQSSGPGHTLLHASSGAHHHLRLRVEHSSNMTELTNLPELLRDITLAFEALGDIEAEYYSSGFQQK